jgi:general secretion pathway protein G
MKKGYTLIEILIVATIIVLLSAAAAVSYSTFLKQSRDAKRKTDLEQIRAALEMYRADNSEYISSTQNVYCTNPIIDYLTTPTKYIGSIPTDPKSSSSYLYRCTISANDYTLGAYLETSPAAVGIPCSYCQTGGIPCNYCIGPYGQIYP